MSTSSSIKLKKAFRTAWRKHPNWLIISIFLTLAGLTALGYSTYYLANPTASSTSVIITGSSSSSSSSTGRSSSSTVKHPLSSSSFASSSSTGSHVVSSSSSHISSSSNILSSSSSSSTGSSPGINGAVYSINAATSTQGYYGLSTQGPTGFIKVSMPPVNRFSQQDYGFFFFNPLYTGNWGSFNFYSNESIFNLTVIYNSYSNTIPSILILLNAPESATAGIDYYVFYQQLPVYQGTVDIDGRCGSVSVSTTNGFLVLTAVNNSFGSYPLKTYCTILNSNTSVTVPSNLKNPYAYHGSVFPGFDANYNGCAVNISGVQTQIHYTAANPSVPVQTQIFLSFGLPSSATFLNINQIATQICTPLGYCQLFTSPCPLNTSYCLSLNSTSYQCICNAGFTGPNCTYNTILQLNMPASPTGLGISSLSRPIASWQEVDHNYNFYDENINNGFIIYTYSNVAGLQLTGFKGCQFVLPVPIKNAAPAQNEFCMEINTRSVLNPANDFNAYEFEYTPPITLAAFVSNPGIYTNTLIAYTNLFNVKNNVLTFKYGFWPMITFQNRPGGGNFHVFGNGSYCEVYNEDAVLTFPTAVGISTGLLLSPSFYYTNAFQFTIPQSATVVQLVSFPFFVSSTNTLQSFSVTWQISGFNQSNLASTYELAQGSLVSPFGQFNYWPGTLTVPLANISHAGDTLYLSFSSSYVFQVSITSVNYGPFLSYSVLPGYCEINAPVNPCSTGKLCLSLSVTSYSCRSIYCFSSSINNPCLNNSTCNNLGAAYSCTCLQGYSGYNCSTVG